MRTHASMTTIDLQYPICQPEPPSSALTNDERAAYIRHISELPTQLIDAARRVGGVRLLEPYRPGGWNGRQVIHHLADSHLNSYTRFKLALTEQNPTICPYDEQAWAELPDVAATPITTSLTLLEALHTRWTNLLSHLSDEQWQRTFYHPGSKRTFTLDQALVLYAWHGRHHLAHVESLYQN